MDKKKGIENLTRPELESFAKQQTGKVAEQTETIKQLEEIVEDQIKTINSLSVKKDSSKSVITVSGIDYILLYPSFEHEGKIYTAADFKTDPSLGETLVKIGSSVLQKK